jgi:hypothetical protein
MKQQTAALDVERQICELMQEAMNTHGVTATVAGATMAIGSLIGTLDRNPEARALAAWTRCFTVCYDAALLMPPRTAGDA